MLYKLVYQSTANPNLTPKDISNILNTARDFNKKNNITGCLIFYNQKFLQILEGDKTTVEELYSRIKLDERHTEVKLLVDLFKRERIFNNWSMAFVDLDSEELRITDYEAFRNNLITYIELIDKSDIVSKVFWNEAKAILTKGKLF